MLGVADSIAAIVSAEDTTESKPHPQGYLLGIAALAGLAGQPAAAQAVVIEDSIAGVEAAKSAHLACIAVTHSYSTSALEAAGADLVVDGLDAITDERLRELHRVLSWS